MFGSAAFSEVPFSAAPEAATGNVTLFPSLFTNSNAFYATTVNPGAVDLTPERYDNNNTFYDATVTTTVTLTPARYDNAQVFYSPTVTQGSVDQTLLPSLYTNDQIFYSPTVNFADTYLRGEGWIPQLKRKRRFTEERDEREQLRKIIEAAVDPVTEKQAKVVTVNGEVAVVTDSQAIPLPVPPTFDAQAVARLAVSVLEAQGIEAQRVRDAKARQQARIALEAMRRKIIKRRREEEILLLM